MLLTRAKQQAATRRASFRTRATPPIIRTLSAPIGGLNGRDAASEMDENDALELTNWFPDFGKVRVRRGSETFATVGTGSFTPDTNPVETLAELQTASTSKLVAAADAKVWEVSAGGEISSTLATGLSNARWQTAVMNATLGLVNGEDAPKTYDGSSWGDMTVSGPGLTVTDLIGINVFKNRSYFAEVNSQSFWFSAVNTLGGVLTEFPLGAVGTWGGHLLQNVTWTRDGGAGMDDLAVFLMSSGEVIVYAGGNPSDSADWQLVGVFRIGKPLGRRAAVKVGGDILVVTVDGPVLLSKVLPGGRLSEGMKMTDKLGSLLMEQARLTGDEFGWQFQYYPRGQFALINYPTGGMFEQFVVNLRSGAWCKFNGLDAACWVVFDENLYFGSGDGLVIQADTGPNDNGADIQAVAKQAFSYLGSRAGNKHVTMVGPLLESAGDIPLTFGLASDFAADADANVSVTLGLASSAAEWDVAEWDVAEWAGGDVAVQAWFAHEARGYAISPQMTISQNAEPVAWNATRLAYKPAGVI